MTFRVPAVVVGLLALAGAAGAEAAPTVDPRPGIRLSGSIQFPRPQTMWVDTDRRDGSRLSVALGFDGPCRGGGLKEAWVSRVAISQTVRVRDGRFAANLTGTKRNIGGVSGRTAELSWRFSGRFLERDVATATVDGTAEIKVNGRVISRCRIDEPATVRLAVRSG